MSLNSRYDEDVSNVVFMDDLFHLESLGGGQEQKRDKEILAAQERIQKLNEAIAEAPDKIIKLFTRKKRK